MSCYNFSIALTLTYDSTRDIKDIKKYLRELKETLTQDEHDKVCTWLESTNPSSNHNDTRSLHEEHTGLWMVRSKEWRSWLDGNIKFLWLHGILGAGKTALASLLVEQATAACSEQKLVATQRRPVVCVYYYCHFSRSQDETLPFLQWLVSQLCRRVRSIPKEIDQLFRLKHIPTTSQALNALQSTLEEFEAVFVIIDAVDESESRQDLLKVLRDLATGHRLDKIQLLATSHEATISSCAFPKFNQRFR